MDPVFKPCLSGLFLAAALWVAPAQGQETAAPSDGTLVTHTTTTAEHGFTVRDWSVQSGAMTVHFDTGQATYLLVKGAPAGVYVKGTGSFRFLATDPVMKPTLLFNLAENTRLKAQPEDKGLALGEPVTEAIFWFAGRDLPQLGGEGQLSLAKDYAAAAGKFEARDRSGYVVATEQLDRPPIGQLLAFRALNGVELPMVSAELIGATERFVYTYDPAYARTESLFIQRPPAENSFVRTIVLAANPIGWDRTAPPDPDFHLTHVDLDLDATHGWNANLHLTETIQVIRPSLRCLVFHFANQHQASTTLGLPTLARTFIRHIRTEDGKDLPFDLRAGYLAVDLGRVVGNNEALKLAFEIDGSFLVNESSSAFNYWRLTPGSHWFPEPGVGGQGYSVKAKIAVSKPLIAIASARTLLRSSTADQNILEVAMDKPISWFSVAAGKYQSIELVRNQRTIRAWCYSGVPVSAERLLKTAHGILEFYDTIMGGVPFDEINLVEVPYLGFGQAPPGLIWLTKEAFNPLENILTRYVAGNGAVGGWSNRMLAHELAHQYWGNRVKMFTYGDNWLSESFAEYTSSMAIRAMKTKGIGTYDSIVADWKTQAAKAAPHGTIPTTQFMQPKFPEGGVYRIEAWYPHQLLYFKGAYLLSCLNKELGDTAFYAFYRAYQKRYAWYPPSTTQDVPDLLKAITGRDYGQWMQDNFWGTGMPQ